MTLDPGRKNSDPESGINIPNPPAQYILTFTNKLVFGSFFTGQGMAGACRLVGEAEKGHSLCLKLTT
jgi:hypothetical protein